MGPLLIYDFDGVIADSEVLANAVLAEMVTELGLPTTLQDAYGLYMGKRFTEVMSAVAGSLGRAPPPAFASDCQARTLARFREELRPVNGVRRYLDAFAHVPKCIASSSSPDRLAPVPRTARTSIRVRQKRLQCVGGRTRQTASRYFPFTLRDRWAFHPLGALFLRTALQVSRRQSQPE